MGFNEQLKNELIPYGIWCINDVVSLAKDGDTICIEYNGKNIYGDQMYSFHFYDIVDRSEFFTRNVTWKTTWFKLKEKDDIAALRWVTDLFNDKNLKVNFVCLEHITEPLFKPKESQ